MTATAPPATITVCPPRRGDVLATSRRLARRTAALEATARAGCAVERARVAQLRDELARDSTRLLEQLEAWLEQLDAETW